MSQLVCVVLVCGELVCVRVHQYAMLRAELLEQNPAPQNTLSIALSNHHAYKHLSPHRYAPSYREQRVYRPSGGSGKKCVCKKKKKIQRN